MLATGEPFGLRDRALLESAADKPRNRFAYGDGDVVDLAICLLVGLAQNHPFIQGNKRAAHTSAITFLEFNGYRWDNGNSIITADALSAYIRGEVTEAFLSDLFRSCLA